MKSFFSFVSTGKTRLGAIASMAGKALFLGLAITGLYGCPDKITPEEDTMRPVIDMWEEVSKQNRLVLDPFNIAFRLNTYITEIKAGNPDKNKIRDSLFGWDGVSARHFILPNADSTEWTIQYPHGYIVEGLKNGAVVLMDSPREGIIKIETGPSKKSLSEAGAEWTLSIVRMPTTPETVPPYMIGTSSNTVWEFRVDSIRWNSYTIRRPSTANTWNVEVNRYTSYNSERKIESSWTMNYVISQSSGDQTFNSVNQSVFSVSNTPAKVFTMHSGTWFEFEIRQPIKYDAKCGFLRKTSGGEVNIRVYRMEEGYFYPTDYAGNLKWIQGDINDDCAVHTTLLYRLNGESKTYNRDIWPESVTL